MRNASKSIQSIENVRLSPQGHEGRFEQLGEWLCEAALGMAVGRNDAAIGIAV